MTSKDLMQTINYIFIRKSLVCISRFNEDNIMFDASFASHSYFSKASNFLISMLYLGIVGNSYVTPCLDTYPYTKYDPKRYIQLDFLIQI